VQKIMLMNMLYCFLLTVSLVIPAKADAEIPLPKGILALDGGNSPPLVLNDLDGQVYDIRKSQGKWRFIHFWASWCGPCKREMRTIAIIAPEFKGSKLEIVLVNTAEDEDTVFSFLGEVAPQLNSLLDSDGMLTAKWRPRGLPSTYLVNPEGKLSYVVLGGRPWHKNQYLNFLRQLIK